MSKLSLISWAFHLCHRARSCLDDLPSKTDKSFWFEQHLRDVSACPLNPSISAVVNIMVIYQWPPTARNLGAPYYCVVFPSYHAANEVIRKEDSVAVAEMYCRSDWLQHREFICTRAASATETKQCFSLCCNSGEDSASRNVYGDGHVVRSSFSGLLVFLIACFSVSLEKRLTQIHPVEEIL